MIWHCPIGLECWCFFFFFNLESWIWFHASWLWSKGPTCGVGSFKCLDSSSFVFFWWYNQRVWITCNLPCSKPNPFVNLCECKVNPAGLHKPHGQGSNTKYQLLITSSPRHFSPTHDGKKKYTFDPCESILFIFFITIFVGPESS